MKESVQQLFNEAFTQTLVGQGDSDQHLMTLFSLVLQTKAKKVLELGVRWGTTSGPLLAGVVMNGGKLTCVDINPTEWRCPEDLQEHYEFIQSDSIQLLKDEVENKSFYNFVWVDDWHAGDHVYNELKLIDKLTDNNSLICLHDCMGGNSQPEYFEPKDIEGEWSNGGVIGGIRMFLKEFPNYEMVTVPVNNGFTILRKK